MILNIIKKSNEHLQKAEQGYFEHGAFAIRYGGEMLIIGIASIIHGIIPTWFLFYVPKRIFTIVNAQIARNVPGEVHSKSLWENVLKRSFWYNLIINQKNNSGTIHTNSIFMDPKFKKHLQAIKQKYFKHGIFAIKQGLYILITGMVSVIHGIIPAWFPFYVPKRMLVIVNMIESDAPKN